MMAFNHKYQPPHGEKKEAPLLEPGWYEFEVIDAYETNQAGEPLVTKGGDPYINFRIQERSTGAMLYYALFFSDDGSARVNAFLFAVGNLADEEIEVSIKASDFVGKTFRGKVEVQPRNGRNYNKIALVRPPDASPPQIEEPGEMPTDDISGQCDDDVPF